MPPKTHLNQEELDQFRERLLARRAEIVGDREGLNAEHEAESGRWAAGNKLSDTPTHPADAALDEQNERRTARLADHEREMIEAIDEAIERIRSRTFGLCLEDFGPISRERLEAKPWARRCLDHARQHEQASGT